MTTPVITPPFHTGRQHFLMFYWPVFVLAVGLAGAGFLLQGHLGFDLADEGFLWYGVQRVMVGEVPLRDFLSYDPGRYYLAAGLMTVFNDNGIVALRAVSAVMQALGLLIGLVALRRVMPRGDVLFLSMAALALAAWMFGHYKQYDKTMVLVLLAALAWMGERPSRQSFFLAGVVIGLAAVVGRNHGVYGALGGLLMLLYLSVGPRNGGLEFRFPAGVVYWAAGIVAGFLPVILMALLVPGFARSLIDSILSTFAYGATNIDLPVPWPWLFPVSEMAAVAAFRSVTFGALFVLLVVFCGLGALLLIGWKWLGRTVSPLLLSAICLAPGYTHYAFSRADEHHLAVGVLPLLLGAMAIAAGLRRSLSWLMAAVVLAVSLLVTHPRHPWVDENQRRALGAGGVPMLIGRDELIVRSSTAQLINTIRRWVREIPAAREVLVVPYWPGIYPLLGKKSPVWEIYALLPQSEAFQAREIERIRQARPGLVVINNAVLDEHRPDHRYFSSHALITRFILENYVALGRMGSNHLFISPDLADPLSRQATSGAIGGRDKP